MIEGRNISKNIGKRRILDELSFSFPSHGFVAITGENGAGKTTLLKIIGLLDSDYQGELWIDGARLNGHNDKELASFRKNRFAYLFQDGNDLSFLSSEENSTLRHSLLRAKRTLEVKESPSQGERILDYLDAIAHSNKSILLLDEVTASLSEENAEKILHSLMSLAKEKLIIFVTHDPMVLAKPSVINYVLESGKLSPDIKLDDSSHNNTPFPAISPEKRKYGFLKKKIIIHDWFVSLLVVLFSATFLFLGSVFTNGISSNLEYELSKLYAYGDEVSLLEKDGTQTIFDEKGNSYDVSTSSFGSDSEQCPRKEKASVLLSSKSDISFYRGDGAAYKNLSSSDPVVTLSKDLLDKGKVKIMGGKAFIGGRLLPYEIRDGYFKYPVVNLNRYRDYGRTTPIGVRGFLWENEHISFVNPSDIKKVLNTDLFCYFVSPEILKERGYRGKFQVQDNDIFINQNYLYYLPTKNPSSFLNLSLFDLGSFWHLYHDYSSFYSHGANIRFDDDIASILGKDEILISQKRFDEIANDFTFYSADLMVRNPSEDTHLLVSLSLSGSEIARKSMEEEPPRISKISALWLKETSRDRNIRYCLPYLIFFYVLDVLSIVLASYIVVHAHKKEMLLLRSFGYSSSQSSSLLSSSFLFGAVLGTIVGVTLVPLAILYINGFKVLFFPSFLTLVPLAIDLFTKIVAIFCVRRSFCKKGL